MLKLRNVLLNAALAATVAGGALAATATSADARVICDRFHCWHVYRPYYDRYYDPYYDPYYYDSYYGPYDYPGYYYGPGVTFGFSFGGGHHWHGGGWHGGGWHGGHGHH